MEVDNCDADMAVNDETRAPNGSLSKSLDRQTTNEADAEMNIEKKQDAGQTTEASIQRMINHPMNFSSWLTYRCIEPVQNYDENEERSSSSSSRCSSSLTLSDEETPEEKAAYRQHCKDLKV